MNSIALLPRAVGVTLRAEFADPVFGEVARALSVRCDQGPDVAGPSDIVSASLRAGVLAADERAVLVEHGARILTLYAWKRCSLVGYLLPLYLTE